MSDPQNFDHWQAEANAWRIELPPQELEPGKVIEGEWEDITPGDEGRGAGLDVEP